MSTIREALAALVKRIYKEKSMHSWGEWGELTSARATLAAQPLAPAPGYCKHCKQYTIEEPLAAQPAQAQKVVGFMVHSSAIKNAALYPTSQHAQALDAAHRWNASITALVCAPGGPDADGGTP